MEKQETSIKEDRTESLPLKHEKNVPTQNLSFAEKLKYIKSNVTVEPALGVFIMSSVIAMLATQNLNLEKACRVNLKFDDEVCKALNLRHKTNYSTHEKEVQKLVASVYAWKSVINALVPTILILFLGAWSDKTGKRKVCMLMPIFGEFVTSLLNIINTYFFYQTPVELTVFMEVLFPALTGGWFAMFLGAYSYLGDITGRENRTFRYGILSLCMTVGFPTGMALSGILLKSIGFYGVFSISCFLKFINFCYVFFCLKDHTWLDVSEKTERTGLRGFIIEFFDFASLKRTFEIVFKKASKNRRLRIVLILTLVCLYFGPHSGETNIMYIFFRYKFNWNEMDFSIYCTYSFLIHSLGTLFSISMLSKRLGADDGLLGIMSTLSKIGGALVLVFARNGPEVYMSPVVEIMSGTTPIMLKSIASKLVTHQELGKLYSLFSITETVAPLVFSPIYSRVYMATLADLPGAVYLITVAATLPATFLFGWFYRQHREDLKDQRLNVSPALPEQVNGSPS